MFRFNHKMKRVGMYRYSLIAIMAVSVVAVVAGFAYFCPGGETAGFRIAGRGNEGFCGNRPGG